MNEDDIQFMNRAIFTDGRGHERFIGHLEPLPIVCETKADADWLTEHLYHMPGVEAEGHRATCLGCGATNNNLRVQEKAGRVTESDVGRPDD